MGGFPWQPYGGRLPSECGHADPSILLCCASRTSQKCKNQEAGRLQQLLRKKSQQSTLTRGREERRNRDRRRSRKILAASESRDDAVRGRQRRQMSILAASPRNRRAAYASAKGITGQAAGEGSRARASYEGRFGSRCRCVANDDDEERKRRSSTRDCGMCCYGHQWHSLAVLHKVTRAWGRAGLLGMLLPPAMRH